MPWEDLEYPSIQLGILLAALEDAGIPARTASLKLDFLEHSGLSVEAYRGIVEWSPDVSLGDWIFSDGRGPDEPYLEFLRSMHVPEETIANALAFRAHVPSFLAAAADEIAGTQPVVVGFTTAFNQTLPSIALAEQLRSRLGDGVSIVFGGANCEGPMGAALQRAFPVIDVVVRGEGELVLPELAADLLAGRPIRPRSGLCYRDRDGQQVVVPESPGAVALDDVPLPSYDEYFERLERSSFADELRPDLTLFYESARGCWWGEKSHCAFCGISDLAMPFRAKSPDRVVSELLELTERYGTRQFLFVDYILARSYFADVLPRLRELDCDLRMFCETKANLSRDEVQLLRDAGFTKIQAGVESLSTPVLKLMRKGVTALQNIRLLKWCAEHGVRLYWNVLYGIPGEPPEEYARMADLVPSLAHLEPPRIVPLQLDRFSPHFERPDEFGIVPVRPRRDFRFVFPPDRVDDETLSEIAYSFEFAYADGRDPETYAAPLLDAIRRWRACGRSAIGSLSYARDRDELVLTDRRPGLAAAEYRLAEEEARIYAACENGSTARALGGPEVEAFLEELVDARLVCKVDGRYLALAIPAKVGAQAPDAEPVLAAT
jgi:ribosomal peptide maturation radical SAM protein 1